MRLGLGARGEPEPELVVHELWSEIFADALERVEPRRGHVAVLQADLPTAVHSLAVRAPPCPCDTAKSLLPVCIST